MGSILNVSFLYLLVGLSVSKLVLYQLWQGLNANDNMLFALIIFGVYAAILYFLMKFTLKRVLAAKLEQLTQDISRHFSEQKLELNHHLTSNSDEFAPVVNAFNQLVALLDRSFIAIKSSVVRLRPMSQELAQASMGLAQRNQLQFSQSREVGERLEGLTQEADAMRAFSEKIVTASKDCLTIANESTGKIREAGNSVNDLNQSIENSMSDVEALQEASKEIGSAIGVIKAISEQTNLLALNAAIEAARAGEAGRGFAVVADEVRNLSGKTQVSSAEIEKMVDDIQGAAEKVIQVMQKGRATTNSLVTTMADVQQNFENVREGNQQISQYSDQIESSIKLQFEHTVTITQTNQEMTSLNEEILKFSKMHGVSEKDLVRLGDYALKSFESITLSQTEFDVSIREKKASDDTDTQAFEEDIELF